MKLKLKQIPLAVAFALVLGAMVPGCTQEASAPAAEAGAVSEPPEAAHAEPHADTNDSDHGHALEAAAGSDFPVPENHVAWTPDAPLIEGMSRVRAALAGLEEQPDEAIVLARAEDIDAAIEFMFDNCQLATEPDIALHAILARLMAGTQALHADPADTAPVHDMHAAVDNYEHLFDDPNE